MSRDENVVGAQGHTTDLNQLQNCPGNVYVPEECSSFQYNSCVQSNDENVVGDHGHTTHLNQLQDCPGNLYVPLLRKQLGWTNEEITAALNNIAVGNDGRIKSNHLKELGKKFKILRERIRWTQNDVAHAINKFSKKVFSTVMLGRFERAQLTNIRTLDVLFIGSNVYPKFYKFYRDSFCGIYTNTTYNIGNVPNTRT